MDTKHYLVIVQRMRSSNYAVMDYVVSGRIQVELNDCSTIFRVVDECIGALCGNYDWLRRWFVEKYTRVSVPV